jgi:16S rRNA (uracil1498-N3)-methyltransferase
VDAPLVFVDDLEAPVLDSADHHHLSRVLRVRSGDAVVAGDGRGRTRSCRFGDPLEPTGDIESHERALPLLTVGFALVKGQRPELIVQKLTELGVDRIIPFAAARSVVRWDPAKEPHRLRRLVTVAREAAMQCRRPWLPDLASGGDFAAVVAAEGASGTLALADPSGDPPTIHRPAVLVGPEGGWAPEERACGLPTVWLGPHILRSETAALAAGVLLSGLRAGIVSSFRSE